MSGVTIIDLGPLEAGPQATSHNGMFPTRSFFNLSGTTACDTPGYNEPCAATRELRIQDPNHLSRVLYTAWGAEKPCHVRVSGVLDAEVTKSRFDASALAFRDQIWRLGRFEHSTPDRRLGGMQTDLLLALMKQNRTMGHIHERLLYDGLRGVLCEIKISSSSWWVPGQDGPDNYQGWAGGDYQTEVESSVRAIAWLVAEWNTLQRVSLAVSAPFGGDARMESQCVWCCFKEDEEEKRAAKAEPK